MRDVPGPLSRRAREQGAPDQMRRLADFVIACVLLAIASPVMVTVALVIKFESSGPILHKHTCIGRGGRGPDRVFEC
jgi:lipopolysaccharide/colanic/teichoic acid biosynthesis glycosyltransferase